MQLKPCVATWYGLGRIAVMRPSETSTSTPHIDSQMRQKLRWVSLMPAEGTREAP